MKKLTQRLNRSLNRNRNGANTTRRNMKTAAKPTNKELKFKTIEGDLLKMPTGAGNYIVQQCCCTCTKPAGLSAIIAKKWPALNPYAERKAVGRTQTATLETRDKFGSAKLIRDEANNVNLICLFAQYGPGKAGVYEDDFVEPVDDGATNRLKKFKVALAKIASIAPAGSTLYFPHGIGSGLGGGKWENYLAAIHDFSKKNEMGYKVVIVHKE